MDDTRCLICNRTEFLPLKCTHCNITTCTEHSGVDAHYCKFKPTDNVVNVPTVSQRNTYCSTKKCTKQTLLLVKCNNCHLDHCVTHNSNHNCIPAYLRVWGSKVFSDSR